MMVQNKMELDENVSYNIALNGVDKKISQKSGLRSGAPCLNGTRLTTTDVISIFIQGEEHDYDLKEEDLYACLAQFRKDC